MDEEIKEVLSEDGTEDIKKKKKKEKKGSFALGFIEGMIFMFALFVVLVIVLALKRMIFIAGGDHIVDSEVIAKADSILTYLNSYSYYDFDEADLKDGMLSGLMAGTGDRYAEYYNPKQMSDMMKDYDGKMYGIGVYIKQNDDKEVYISGTIEGAPADSAGFMEGDVIKAVDGEDVTGLDRFSVAEKVRGEKGKAVVITVYRASTDETLDISVVRDEITKLDVQYRMLNDTIGYIYITEFDEVAIDQFADALATLRGQGMEDLVLDLRTNTGGLVKAALDITRQLMCKGVIVTTRTAEGKEKTYDCNGKKEFQGQIVILTDGYTASASEIVAGALRDNGMAVTLGTTTYGKGIVQNFYYLSDGSGIKFTTEQYFTPNGTAIHGVGIEPDVELEFDYDRYMEDKTDNQIEAAIEYIENH